MGCTSSSPANAGLSETERVMNGRRGIDKSERTSSRNLTSSSERARILNAANTSAAKDAAEPSPPKLDSEGHLMAEEVAKRISGSVESQDAILGKIQSGNNTTEEGLIHVRYAALTQRGYYPDKPHKENQDAYKIIPSDFASGEGDAFFAVFDGHGDKGGDCADFARRTLHSYLAQNLKKRRAAENAKRLREMSKEEREEMKREGNAGSAFHPKNWPYLDVEGYEGACRTAHAQCNKAMHDDKKVKDSVSGTTAISVGFHAGRMTVSNVGDSRAVLGCRISTENREMGSTPAEEEKKEIGEEDEDDDAEHHNHQSSTHHDGSDNSSSGKLVAIPLSEDQTPYRKDERERLKKAGARICSIDQMEGIEPMHEDWGEVDLGIDIDEEGDPPRVWYQDHDYPGTAFSRSLGDTVGKDIGVNAVPEILTKEVTKGDEILVIASDGVFEFLTNQRVIDICAECDDPQHACTRLLEESYKQWLHYELRTDDITCIVLFLKNGRENDDEIVRSLRSKKHNIKKAKTSTSMKKRELSVPDNIMAGLVDGKEELPMPENTGPVDDDEEDEDEEKLSSSFQALLDK